jgi:hypothetical protein
MLLSLTNQNLSLNRVKPLRLRPGGVHHHSGTVQNETCRLMPLVNSVSRVETTHLFTASPESTRSIFLYDTIQRKNENFSLVISTLPIIPVSAG